MDTHSQDDRRGWYERFARVGLQLEPEEVLVKGWPWRTTVCVHFTDHATNAHGERVYENQGVFFAKMSWGKITLGTVYEDTQKVATFDEYLAEHEPAVPATPQRR